MIIIHLPQSRDPSVTHTYATIKHTKRYTIYETAKDKVSANNKHSFRRQQRWRCGRSLHHQHPQPPPTICLTVQSSRLVNNGNYNSIKILRSKYFATHALETNEALAMTEVKSGKIEKRKTEKSKKENVVRKNIVTKE